MSATKELLATANEEDPNPIVSLGRFLLKQVLNAGTHGVAFGKIKVNGREFKTSVVLMDAEFDDQDKHT